MGGLAPGPNPFSAAAYLMQTLNLLGGLWPIFKLLKLQCCKIYLLRPTSGFSSLWLPLLIRTHQRMRDYKECLQQNLPTNIFSSLVVSRISKHKSYKFVLWKISFAREKFYISLAWLNNGFNARTLDWDNSLKISLSSLCIEVKRVRKKSRPRNPQDDVFEQFHAAIHDYLY